MTNTLLNLVSVLATLTTQLYTIGGAGHVTKMYTFHTIQMSWQWPYACCSSHMSDGENELANYRVTILQKR